MSALGGFTAGLFEGLDTARRARRGKRYDAYMDSLLDKEKRAVAATNEDETAASLKYGRESQPWNPIETREPALFQLTSWASDLWKNKFGFAGNEEVDATVATESADDVTKGGGQRTAIPMADGGMVDEDEGISGIDAALAAGAATAAPKARAIAARVAPAAARVGTALAPAAKRYAPIAAAYTAAETAGKSNDDLREQYGQELADTSFEEGESRPKGWRGVLHMLQDDQFWQDYSNRAKDVGDTALNALTFGGYDAARNLLGGGDEPAPEAPTTAIPVGGDKAAATAAVAADEPPPADEVAATATAEAAAKDPHSAAAVKANEEMPYEEIPEWVTPDDMPAMTTEDWKEYRYRAVRAGLLRGLDLTDAEARVDKMQHDGFMRELTRAQMYLQNGDARSAAFAVKQAYQYFPNGSAIRLGIQQGREGQPVLVAQAFDENGNEAKGNPAIITPETLSMQRANFANPDSWRVWKTDYLDRDMRERVLQHRVATDEERLNQGRDRVAQGDRALDIQEFNAVTGAAGAGSGSGGLKQTDLDRASEQLFRQIAFQKFGDEQEAYQMAEQMSVIYKYANGRLTPDQVAAAVNGTWPDKAALQNKLAEFGLDSN